MKIEERIQECENNLNQVKHFEPEPFYVGYFLGLFLKELDLVYDSIFEEANIDFGLFIIGRANKEKFQEKANEKNDEKALEFVKWFENQMSIEHQNPYPQFMKKLMDYRKKVKRIPEIKIMLRAKERYLEDVNQEITVSLNRGKLRSKEELEIEKKRITPVFLEIINHKRILKKEPKVSEKQVVVSTFLEIDNMEFEISYLMEIYIPVLRRICSDSIKKIQEMTQL